MIKKHITKEWADMKLLEIKDNEKYIERIKDIYISSFPEVERVDFKDLIEHKKYPGSKLLGVFNDDCLVGFSYVSTKGNFAYIIYLAIASEYRNKNYGTTALKLICDMYKDKTMSMCVEKPEAPNDEPTRRINFYKRNGFKVADLEYIYLGQKYNVMYNGNFDEEKFVEFFTCLFPYIDRL